MVSTPSVPDRHDPQQAAEVFRALVPDAAQASVASLLANIIERAHREHPASWSATLFRDKIRINVGQVEVCTLIADTCHLVVVLPLPDLTFPGLVLNESRNPAYPAVPIASGMVDIDLLLSPSVPAFCQQPLFQFVDEAANRKRRSPFKSSFSIGFVAFLEEALGVTLPRPSYLAASDEALLVTRTPQEVLSFAPLIEGAVRRIEVNAYERDAQARRICLQHYGPACRACGMSFGAVYGAEFDGFIHVHHLRPLSEIGAAYQVNPIEDLTPVCPNCHAIIHSRSPPLSVDEVRALLNAASSA